MKHAVKITKITCKHTEDSESKDEFYMQYQADAGLELKYPKGIDKVIHFDDHQHMKMDLVIEFDHIASITLWDSDSKIDHFTNDFINSMCFDPADHEAGHSYEKTLKNLKGFKYEIEYDFIQ